MARSQTVFSELSVAAAIGDCDVAKVKNVDKASLSQFEAELSRRKNNDRNSINQLRESGLKIRKWILQNQADTKINVAWTGMQKNAGELLSVAQDLLIENSGLRISVKEDAKLFQNPSPYKVFSKWPEGDYSPSRDEDWFLKVAEVELNYYFTACNGYGHTGAKTVKDYYAATTGKDDTGNRKRKRFTEIVKNLHDDGDVQVLSAYKAFCDKVSEESANSFNDKIKKRFSALKNKVDMVDAYSDLVAFFFRLDQDAHILCGIENGQAFAILVDTLDDWKKKFSLTGIEAKSLSAGQPEVLIAFNFVDKRSKKVFDLSIKAEVRWSHGKFCGNPESKLYRYGNWTYPSLPWVVSI